jgi:hypothetical protein
MLSSITLLLGLAEAIIVPTAISAVILSAFVGLFSLWRNHKEGLFREDPLYMMQLLFYFGLLIFSIGEAAVATSILFPDDVLISYLPSLTRTFGMIFWLLGVLNYVRATNQVLEFINIKVGIFLILICGISVVSVAASMYFSQTSTNIIVMANFIIFSLGIGIMTYFMLYLAWIFWNGKLRDILLSVFSCLFLLLIRCIVIAYSDFAIFTMVSLALALEAYVCLLASESLFFRLMNS